MNARLLLAAGCALALSGLVAASVAATRSPGRSATSLVSPPVRRSAGPPVNPSVRRSSGPSVDSIISHNVFAPGRRPPPLRYGVEESGPQEQPSAVTGTLTLVGVLLGARPVAVLQGIPGASGDRLLSVGDSVTGYVLVHVDPRSVVLIRGSGDTLRLALREGT